MINWEGVKFPSSNGDIDGLEQNNGGLVSTTVFEAVDLLSAEKVIKAKNHKVINAKHHCDLLRFYDEKSFRINSTLVGFKLSTQQKPCAQTYL